MDDEVQTLTIFETYVPGKANIKLKGIDKKIAKRFEKRSPRAEHQENQTTTDELELQSGNKEWHRKCQTDTSVSAGNTCRVQVPISKLGANQMPTSRPITNLQAPLTLQGMGNNQGSFRMIFSPYSIFTLSPIFEISRSPTLTFLPQHIFFSAPQPSSPMPATSSHPRR